MVLGCIKLGAVPMPATTLLTPRDIAYRLNSAEANVAVVDAEGTTKVDQITARFWQDLKPTDLHWTVSDFGWAKAAWGKLFGQWALGAAVFLWDVRGKPDFDLMLRLLGEYGVTTFCAPPTVYRALVLLDLAGYDWSRLRHCVSAGEPLNPR